jgi:hypothetical protein
MKGVAESVYRSELTVFVGNVTSGFQFIRFVPVSIR